MLEETDFTKEAANLAEFSAYLDAAGMRATATCPFVYTPFSSSKCVLTKSSQGRLEQFSDVLLRFSHSCSCALRCLIGTASALQRSSLPAIDQQQQDARSPWPAALSVTGIRVGELHICL